MCIRDRWMKSSHSGPLAPGSGLRAPDHPFKTHREGDQMKPNYKQMMKQAQKLQVDMEKAQEELAEESVEASAGGGMVTVEVGGDMTIRSININPDAVDPEDVEMLEDMILAATNEAVRNARELSDKRMGSLTQGLNLPGM